MKQIYRLVRTEPAYLLDKYGNKYYFELVQDSVTKEWEYRLPAIPEFLEDSPFLYGKSVREIIDSLNLSEAVIIKGWNE